VSVLARIAELAREDGSLWGDALLPQAAERAQPRFAHSCPERYLLGVEMIYEGYLLHYGRSRLFGQGDERLALLTGDYLYAAGLERICRTGDLEAVSALAGLISRCASRRGLGAAGGDEALWEETVAGLGTGAAAPVR
jgi:hypothetical protein